MHCSPPRRASRTACGEPVRFSVEPAMLRRSDQHYNGRCRQSFRSRPRTRAIDTASGSPPAAAPRRERGDAAEHQTFAMIYEPGHSLRYQRRANPLRSDSRMAGCLARSMSKRQIHQGLSGLDFRARDAAHRIHWCAPQPYARCSGQIAVRALKRTVGWLCQGSVKEVVVGMVEAKLIDRGWLERMDRRKTGRRLRWRSARHRRCGRLHSGHAAQIAKGSDADRQGEPTDDHGGQGDAGRALFLASRDGLPGVLPNHSDRACRDAQIRGRTCHEFWAENAVWAAVEPMVTAFVR